MNPNLPVGGSAFDQGGVAAEALPEDVTQAALTLRFSLFDTVLKGWERRANVDEQAVRTAVASLTARHHFGEGLSAELTVPAGTLQLDPGREEPTRYLNGFGDVMLAGRYDLAALWGAGGYRPSVVLEGGLGVPTGSQVKAEAGALPPSILSLGRASFAASARVLATQYVHRRVGLVGWLGIAEPLTPSGLGITLGRSIDGGIGAQLNVADVAFLGTRIAGQYLERSREAVVGSILNSGGTWLAAEVSLAMRLHERASLVVAARAPFLASVNGEQVSETFTVTSGLAFTFGNHEDDDDDHAHGSDDHAHDGDDHAHDGDDHADDGDDHADDGDDHAHDGDERAAHVGGDEPKRHAHGDPQGDIIDAARGGASFSLGDVVAPGKVTVIDFWAEWCAPCHELDRVLRELAAQHPNLA
ncbi:MAG: TlpA family protein disulfide reductase, partial [Myxococcota bacterium]